LRLTVAVDDLAGGRGTLAEHGLSVLLETGGERLLFDTGQGMALPTNLQRLDVDPAGIGTCVLSHGHYDHTGGLDWLLERSPGCRVVAHPGVFREMWSLAGGRHAIGCPTGRPRSAGLLLSADPVEVLPGVTTTGEVPRQSGFEKVPGHFVDAGGGHDDIPDDMGLVIRSPMGVVLLAGCAHSGAVNMSLRARELAGRPPVVVVGGLHLSGEDPARVERTGRELAGMGVRMLCAGHCTGESQLCALAGHFEACRRIRTGFTLDLTGDINGLLR
jgi:7,8-dihydropterin-6-yl-methyl-4-(beta-D-ribofuranosyl)aminobenzene 5'-phosphate synthase